MRVILLALLLASPAVAQSVDPLDAFTRLRISDPGFGPSNASACLNCHENPVQLNGDRTIGGSGPTYRSAIWQKLLPSGTPFIAHRFATSPVPNPAGNFAVSNRIPPTTFGSGLVEKIYSQTLIQLSDPNDVNGDGISGRPNVGAGFQVKRFGSQACEVTLEGITRKALSDEFGITAAEQAANAAFYDNEVALLLEFMRDLPAPEPVIPPGDEALVAQGEQVFDEVGCTGCHTAAIVTSENEEIHPYSDFLLHDMGRSLDDAIGLCGATSAEWRTAPLWQFRISLFHDGRVSRSIVLDVLRWHGGESTGVVNAFFALGQNDQLAVEKFLLSR